MLKNGKLEAGGGKFFTLVFVRNGYEFIRNQAVMPALTLFGDALWDGREDGEETVEDEEYYMREPTRITLKKGWNHVKLTIPCKRAANHAPWVGTFIPLLGTTEHPREVPGLEYSCIPK